ncbi:MAG: hypothetical protein V4603_05585 [Pseudomonadota bacterium]
MTDSDKLNDELRKKLQNQLAGTPLQLTRRTLLPGIESGQYEPLPVYDKSELRTQLVDELVRRDNRISVRVSGRDLNELQKLALAEGIPTQSLIANIIHHYVQGELVKAVIDHSPFVSSKPESSADGVFKK